MKLRLEPHVKKVYTYDPYCTVKTWVLWPSKSLVSVIYMIIMVTKVDCDWWRLVETGGDWNHLELHGEDLALSSKMSMSCRQSIRVFPSGGTVGNPP